MSTRTKALALISLLLSVLLINLSDGNPAQAAGPIPIRWMYFVNGRSNDSFAANASLIDIVSPNFYQLKADGSVRPIGVDQSSITSFAHSKGVKVVPMIQNDSTKDDFNKLFSDPVKVKSMLDAIESQVVAYNYDGFQIDFEDLNLASEPLLTNFIHGLNDRLKPRGKLTTMAVVSRVSSLPTSQFSAAYNYHDLAPFLDLVTVMTYDYSWSAGQPGPVAPVDWQERVMNYAVPQFGAAKILLGIPFYGYDWNLTKRQTDPTFRASSSDFNNTLQLQKDNNGSFGYDNVAQEPYLDYSKNGEAHKLWFENARSLQAKFDMMKRLQLRGFASWRLGHEGAEFWPVIKNLVTPTRPVPSPGPDTTFRVFYKQTGHTLQGTFKKYWEKYGGLAQFGYPWTEEFDEASPSEAGKNFTVQYYERNRFEYHPEFVGTQYEVELGLLGRQVTAGRETELPFQRVDQLAPAIASRASLLLNMVVPGNINRSALTITFPAGVDYYKETGHSLRGEFKDYWQQNGGLFIYGYPISEEFSEVNPADGKTYLVQYFERNRFEYHPEFVGTKYKVLMGLLGNQLMTAKGWF